MELSMTKFHYSLVDVFTDRPFGGNPLAVFPDARGLSTETMQALAKEFNLSETTFVLPPRDSIHDHYVRIFTPATELPIAGHPTLGTAFVLARDQPQSQPAQTAKKLLFEEGVGTVPVVLQYKGHALQSIQMTQPLPTFGAQWSDRKSIAAMLSLSTTDFDDTLPLETVSCGVPFLYVALKSQHALQSIRFRRDLWEQTWHDFEAQGIFVFTQEQDTSDPTVHSRMFAPAMGIQEDPATGAASGPLGCFLVQHKRVPHAPVAHILSKQGFEMGRPSFVHITIEQNAEQISAVYVSGQCCFMGEGVIELAEE
jgi:trans-2,3-dihydro-3-hydroxyanthranilate isomerase